MEKKCINCEYQFGVSHNHRQERYCKKDKKEF